MPKDNLVWCVASSVHPLKGNCRDIDTIIHDEPRYTFSNPTHPQRTHPKTVLALCQGEDNLSFTTRAQTVFLSVDPVKNRPRAKGPEGRPRIPLAARCSLAHSSDQ